MEWVAYFQKVLEPPANIEFVSISCICALAIDHELNVSSYIDGLFDIYHYNWQRYY